MIAMIDMGMGNLGSLASAFVRIGCPVSLTTDVRQVSQAGLIILPGVGNFSAGSTFLKKSGMAEVIQHRVAEGKAGFLGICVGMQLLADFGEENGRHEGLGLIPGHVSKLTPSSPEFKVPNMGWGDVHSEGHALFDHVDQGEGFYFAHSYHFSPEQEGHAVARLEYDQAAICAAVARDNIIGIQFHPEKSQDPGLTVLHNAIQQLTTNKDGA